MKLSSALTLVAALIVGSATALSETQAAEAGATAAKPTVVLIHGAMADASSWNELIPRLQAHGFRVIAAANPLRDLKGDADYVNGLVTSIPGPVVLVGHSYGGAVISNVASGNLKALVYVAAFAPEAGETAFDLVGKFPGSLLGAALAPPVMLAGGGKDLYVDPLKFKAPFAADVSDARARVMAATLRPVTEAALTAPSGTPSWKSVPSWFVYGSADKSIPPATHAFMAERASARKVLVVKGASHIVMVSHPQAVEQIIEDAAR
jgi:pimeloyl-ACP methyl ester carboxylesterase